MSKPPRNILNLPALLIIAVIVPLSIAASPPSKTFDIPSGDAAETLKLFTRQSSEQVVYPPREVRGVTTNAIKGRFTPLAALRQMLTGTALSVLYDERTGAMAIKRNNDPNAGRATPTRGTGARPTQNKTAFHSKPSSSNPDMISRKRPPAFKRVLSAIAAFIAAVPIDAQTEGGGAYAATGTIEGRVFDVRRGEYLEKARITIEGTVMETLTDGTGFYRLDRVPAGPAKVVIFYTGLGSQAQSVSISPGQTLQHDITFSAAGRATTGSEVVKLDEFVVATSKEMDGAAIAINEQRFASNIVNVVSADEFGTIADGSIGEFMKFLPGITSDYTGGDARRFSINGVPAGNVPISMGGFDLASAAGAGTGRQVELDQVSINSVARIEVNHSPTPESPGMALAGSVNFVPRSAFERSKPSFSYSVAMLMKDSEKHLHKTPGPRWRPTRKIHPGVDFSAIVPVNRNFGFTLSAGYSLQYTPQDMSRMDWRGVYRPTTVAADATNGFPDTTPDNPYVTQYTHRDGAKETERYSFATTVDYRLGPRDRLSFRFQYAYLGEAYANRYMDIIINRVAPGNWGPDHTWGQYSTRTLNAGQINLTAGARLRPGRTFMPTLNWRHDGPVWKLESGISYSSSRINYLDIDKGSFNGATARRTNVTILFDDIFYLRPNKITVLDADGVPIDPYNLENYSLVSGTSTRQKTYDTKRQAYANARRDLRVRGVPVSLKAGLDVRTAVRDLRGVGTETYNFVGADGRASSTPITSAGLPNDDTASIVLDESFSTRVPNHGFPPIQRVNNEEFWGLYQSNPEYFTHNANTFFRNATNASKRAEEIVSSAYIRADAAFLERRLKVVGGLRAEQTNIKAEGPLSDPTLNYRHDAGGNIIYRRDASGEIIRNAAGIAQPELIHAVNTVDWSRLTLLDRGFQFKKEYLRLFPSVNLSYNVRENLIARFSYYQSLGRPNFNQYAGGVILPNLDAVPSSGNRIRVTNVGIKAWQAETYRVRFEYYFPRIGQISIGAFQRNFENFFGTVVTTATPEFLAAYDLDEETYGPYEVSTQYNITGIVRQRGLEFDYKQALTFLPHWARGVQVFFNASSQRARGTDSFQDMTPFSANWGASLTRPKFNLRVNYNYRGAQRRGPIAAGRGIVPGTYTYRAKRLYIDVAAEYYFHKRFGVFAALRNVGDATEDDKVYGPDTPDTAKFWRRQDYHSLWTFGVKGRF